MKTQRSKRRWLLKNAINRTLERTIDEEMKAKWIELSPLVEDLASYDNFSEENVLEILMHLQTSEKFFEDIFLQIDKEMTIMTKNILVEVQSRQQRSKSINRLNQADTGNLKNEGPSETTNDDQAWIEREQKRRLGTHVEVKRILEQLPGVLEANASKLEDFRRLREQASSSGVDETGSSTSK